MAWVSECVKSNASYSHTKKKVQCGRKREQSREDEGNIEKMLFSVVYVYKYGKKNDFMIFCILQCIVITLSGKILLHVESTLLTYYKCREKLNSPLHNHRNIKNEIFGLALWSFLKYSLANNEIIWSNTENRKTKQTLMNARGSNISIRGELCYETSSWFGWMWNCNSQNYDK